MCECNLIIGRDAEGVTQHVVDDYAYDPVRFFLTLASLIQQGECEPASAGHLLSAIECETIAVEQLPLSLGEIERIARRKLYDPIM